MDDMEAKLGAILGNPQLMEQIMDMAQSLGQSGPRQETATAPASQGFDPALLQKLSGLASQSTVDRDQQALLQALTPFLSGNRIEKLEKAMRAAKMARAASGFLGAGGLSLLTGR